MVPFLYHGGVPGLESILSLKQPLAERAARLLREGIQAGRWQRELPAERQLVRDLGIARNTLRDALASLTREGWVEPACRPARRRIAGGARRRAPRRQIVLLTPFEPDDLPAAVLRLADDVRRLLAGTDYRLAVRGSAAFRQTRPDAALARLVAAEPAAVWVLLQAPTPVHAWFHRRGAPCVVVGECYPELPLPHVTEHIAAVARHAAGLLHQRGHQRIALLHRDPPRAGHLAAEAALRSAGGLVLQRAGHDGTPAAAARTLEALFGAAAPPTALVVTEPGTAITAITWLARRGLRVPEQVSVLSLFYDSTLEAVIPAVANYRTGREVLPRRLIEMVRALADGRRLPHQRPLMPNFVPGGSLGRVSSGSR